ncbi:MAG: helix-turn-helix transcriptional regulator [Anaerolineales bacterium]
MIHEPSEGQRGCRCQGGGVQGFIRPRLLLQLAQQRAYGYELLEMLEREQLPTPDSSTLYRTLRHFEEHGWVRSVWDTEGGGPARRVYEITDAGVEHLHAWAGKIRHTREQLGRFLDEYEDHFQKQDEGGE